MNSSIKKAMKLGFCFAVVFWISACTDTPDSIVGSDVVATSDIYAVIQLVDEGGDKIQAQVQFTVEVPPTPESEDDIFVELQSKDEVLVTTGPDIDEVNLEGQNVFEALDRLFDIYVPLERAATLESSIYLGWTTLGIIGNNIWYTSKIASNEDRSFNVPLIREEFIEAGDTQIKLPGTFTLTPLTGEYSRAGQDIGLTWSPVDAQASVAIIASTSCLGGGFETFVQRLDTDDGAYTIPAGSLVADDLIGACNTTVRVEKYLVGQLDARFAGGIASGHVLRQTAITTTD